MSYRGSRDSKQRTGRRRRKGTWRWEGEGGGGRRRREKEEKEQIACFDRKTKGQG